MSEILHNKLDTKEIKQTTLKLSFRDLTIAALKNSKITFGKSRFKWFKFDVSKGSSLKGLRLRVSKNTGSKHFVLQFWFQGKSNYYYGLGAYPKASCRDVEKKCIELDGKAARLVAAWNTQESDVDQLLETLKKSN